MMISKKASLVILIAGLAMNPVAVSSQIEEVGIAGLQEKVPRSWDEIVVIWDQACDSLKLFWQRYATWRLVPMWEGIKRWANDQVMILRETLRKDMEIIGRTIKEEVSRVSENIKSMWQTIF